MTTKPPLGLYWLASYPKSGNTWIRCILEHYFLGRLEVNRLALVKSDQNTTVRSRIPLPGELPPHIQKIVRPAACVAHMVHWDYNLGPCILKTHYQWRKSVASITAGSVYLVRDPRDIACSLSRHLDCPIDTAIATMGDKELLWENHGNLSEVGSWSDHVRGWADRADILVKYEDLRRDPVPGAKQIVTLLGGTKPVQPSCKAAGIGKLRRQESETGFAERRSNNPFFGPAKVGGWEEVLTPDQARRIEADHGAVMKEHGYLP